jgi:hypothetical protein
LIFDCGTGSAHEKKDWLISEGCFLELTNPPGYLIILPFLLLAAPRRTHLFLEAFMRKNLWALAALVFILSLALAACSGGPNTAAKDPAAAAVESFLAAAVAKDSTKVSSLVCKDFESDALLFMDGFQAVTAELSNVSCKNTGTASGSTLVSCTGAINTTYNGEKGSLDLSRQTYKVTQQGGNYLVCGNQ